MTKQANSLYEVFSPTLDKDNLNFELKIDGTTYEICTRFNINGKQSVLKQFKNLILSENLI